MEQQDTDRIFVSYHDNGKVSMILEMEKGEVVTYKEYNNEGELIGQ